MNGLRGDLQRGGIDAALDHAAVIHVCDDLVLLVVDAPGLEEIAQIRAGVDELPGLASHRILLAAVSLGEQAHRIDKGDHIAAAEQILVDGELGALRDVRGVDDDEDRDVRVDLVRGGRHFTHFVVVAQLLDDRPGLLAALTLHHVHGRTTDGQRTHEADDRFRRLDDLGDGAGDFILKRGGVIRAEERQHLFAIEALHAHAEVDIVAFLIDLHAADFVLLGLVFLIGVRIRTDDLEGDVATALLFVFEEQVLDHTGMRLEDVGHHAVVIRGVKADADRLIGDDAGDDVPRAVREGVQTVLGEIDAEIADADRADEEVQRHNHGDDEKGGDTDSGCLGRSAHGWLV